MLRPQWRCRCRGSTQRKLGLVVGDVLAATEYASDCLGLRILLSQRIAVGEGDADHGAAGFVDAVRGVHAVLTDESTHVDALELLTGLPLVGVAIEADQVTDLVIQQRLAVIGIQPVYALD